MKHSLLSAGPEGELFNLSRWSGYRSSPWYTKSSSVMMLDSWLDFSNRFGFIQLWERITSSWASLPVKSTVLTTQYPSVQSVLDAKVIRDFYLIWPGLATFISSYCSFFHMKPMGFHAKDARNMSRWTKIEVTELDFLFTTSMCPKCALIQCD